MAAGRVSNAFILLTMVPLGSTSPQFCNMCWHGWDASIRGERLPNPPHRLKLLQAFLSDRTLEKLALDFDVGERNSTSRPDHVRFLAGRDVTYFRLQSLSDSLRALPNLPWSITSLYIFDCCGRLLDWLPTRLQ
jgi:hypothetical protein